jgi:hypothetical protein
MFNSNSWLLTVAGFILLLAPQAVPAQAPSTSVTPGGTTSTPTMGGGGGGGGGGTGGGSSSSGNIGGTAISGTSFNNLGPSATSSMAPSLAIGGSNTASITGRTTTGTGTTTPVPTSYNPWMPYYLNLYQPGLGSSLTGTPGRSTTSTGGAFGQALYTVQTATTTTSPTGTNTANTQTQTGGFTTFGLNKAPSYVTGLSDDFVVSRPTAGQLQKQLSATLNRSSALKGQGTIELSVKGSEVTLKGQVARDQLRRLAEGLVRMTPGVSDVRNDLQVTAAKK